MGKKKFLIGGIIILIAIGSLGFMAFQGAATYYYTVGEVTGKGSAMYDQNIRVSGQVTPNSVIRESTGSNLLKFTLVDRDNNTNRLMVAYKGAVPDAFKEGNDAVVEGKISSSGVFEAEQIIVKCPSKYEPQQ